MIKKLRRKFIFISITSFAAIMLAIVALIGVFSYIDTNRHADEILSILAENDGRFPDEPIKSQQDYKKPPRNKFTPETKFVSRYFLVRADADKNIVQIDTSHIAAITADTAEDFALDILSSNKKTGYKSVYRYLVTDSDSGALIIFLDCSQKLNNMYSAVMTAALVAVISLLIVLIPILLFSRRATAPVIESLEKQKQFIADASHELKTPLSIIGINNDLIEQTYGQNEWSDSIRRQNQRLSGLIGSMLNLSKLEGQSGVKHTKLNFSDIAADTLDAFTTPAKAAGKSISGNIQPDVYVYGDRDMLYELISILLDNAIKYSNPYSTINLSLAKQGRKAQLMVSNSAPPLSKDEIDRIFDRFYRPDSSRSRQTGGYGLGLSIAKTIAQNHNADISAQSENNLISFKVTFN